MLKSEIENGSELCCTNLRYRIQVFDSIHCSLIGEIESLVEQHKNFETVLHHFDIKLFLLSAMNGMELFLFCFLNVEVSFLIHN